MLWLTSRAALPLLKTALLPSSVSSRQLRDLAAEIDALGIEPVERAVEAAIAHRTERYLAGLEAYRHHRFRRHSASRPIVWHEGTTRLLDYGRDAKGPTVLVIPSLINRYYVLDLLPERSFLQHLANSGLRVLVIDWQAPGVRSAISIWATTSPVGSKPLSRQQDGSPTARSGLSVIAWGACSRSRWRCVASVRSPVLRCSRPPGIFMPKVGRLSP